MFAAIGPDDLIYGIGETASAALKDARLFFSLSARLETGEQPTLRVVELSHWNDRHRDRTHRA